MEQYAVIYHDFSASCLIEAPDAAIAALSEKKCEAFPQAPWMWARQYVRFHACRLFEVGENLVRCEGAFVCDNRFDLWLNGQPIAAGVRELGLRDLTDLVRPGENNLHLRAYQTDTPARFGAAITGGLRLFYADGHTEEVLTDGGFRQLGLINFWQTEEPEGFESIRPEDAANRLPMSVTEYHPIARRRSFYMRRCFALPRLPVRAVLRATAEGLYEPYLNGNRLTDARLIPSATERCREFQCFDLLPFLHEGDNCLGVLLGNGWYNCESWGVLSANRPAFVCEAELTFGDGEVQYLRSDGAWECRPSPLTENDLQFGERYDARLESDDWCLPQGGEGFVPVSARAADLRAALQNYPPVRAVVTHRPRRIGTLPGGAPLFDLGINIAGRARAVFRGLRRGQCVRLRYCERLREDGQPENYAYGAVFYPQDTEPDGLSPWLLRNMDCYVAAGRAEEAYECRFAYTGFRYLWVEGLESEDQLCLLEALELHNDLRPTVEIASPCSAVTDLFTAVRQTWYNNLCNGPTDCPTREKNYWNGDMQIFSTAACFLTDNSGLLARWTDCGRKMHAGPYGWEDETYILPMTLWRFYGDEAILRRRYPEMLALIERRTESPDMILPEHPQFNYCDWLSPRGVSPDPRFFAGCYWYKTLTDVATAAEALGDDRKAAGLRRRAAAVREEFNRRYLTDGGSDYAARCQAGLVLPLAFGLAPDDRRGALAATLDGYIRREDFHLSTGFIGTRYLLPVLCDNGYTDTAVRLLLQTDFPSWRYILSTGATNMTESWLGMRDPDRSLSMCHYSLGAVVGWFFEYLGGLRIGQSSPGLSRVVLAPVMPREIGGFSMRYETPRGILHTAWHYEGDRPVFTYSAPAGTEVLLRIPEATV